MEYNGSGMIAMTGKNCVAICSDTRFGVQQVTVGTDFQRIFQMHDKLFMGLPGLGTDVLTLYDDCALITKGILRNLCIHAVSVVRERSWILLCHSHVPRIILDCSEQNVRFQLKMYQLREERAIKPAVFANLVSNMLYEKRYVGCLVSIAFDQHTHQTP